MKWLITGASGYIGSHLVRHLISTNLQVVCTDLVKNSRSSYLESLGAEFCFGDLRDSAFVNEIVSRDKFQGIVHLAALKSVARSSVYSEDYQETNIGATYSLIESAERNQVTKFIFASSAAVYGANDNLRIKENSLLSPASYYGVTKLRGEEICKSSKTINSISLRFFNVVGSKILQLQDDSTENVLPIFLSMIKSNQSPRVFGSTYETEDGSCARDYIHVDDVIEAISYFMLNQWPSIDAINVGAGIETSVLSLIEQINASLGTSVTPTLSPMREGDVARVIANTDSLNQLGIFPRNDATKMAISEWKINNV